MVLSRAFLLCTLLLAALAACSSTPEEEAGLNPGGDQSTCAYLAPAAELTERIRTYLQSRSFRVSVTGEAKTQLTATLITRRPIDAVQLEVSVQPAQGRPDVGQVVVTGTSNGGTDSVVRQWQMRIHRHLRNLYSPVEG